MKIKVEREGRKPQREGRKPKREGKGRGFTRSARLVSMGMVGKIKDRKGN